MANVFTRRNAFLGWAVWKLARRRLRKKLRVDDAAPTRRRVLRSVIAVAVLAGLAAAVAKRVTGGGETAET